MGIRRAEGGQGGRGEQLMATMLIQEGLGIANCLHRNTAP